MITRDEIFATGLPLQATFAVAAKLSEGRTVLTETAIGPGSVLQAVGLDVGNALLDVIYSNTKFRYVKLLLDRETLDVSLPVVQQGLDELALAGIPGFGAPQAQAIKDLARVPEIVTEQEVINVLAGA